MVKIGLPLKFRHRPSPLFGGRPSGRYRAIRSKFAGVYVVSFNGGQMPPAWVSYVRSGALRSMDVRRNGATVRELESSRRAQVQMLRMPQAITPRPTPPRWRGGVPDEIAARLSDSSVETQLKVAPWTTLLDARCDHLDLTGTKKVAIMANAACARC